MLHPTMVPGVLYRAGAIAALIGLLTVAPVAEPQPAPGGRIAINTGLRGIDRGLRLEDEAKTGMLAPDGPGDGLPYEPGRVIVKLRPGLGPPALAAVMRSVGATASSTPSSANFHLLTIGADEDPEEVARALGARPDVEYAQAAYRVALHQAPNDPMYRLQWNFSAIDMERAWDIGRGAGGTVTVAVLDSGVAFADVVLRYNTLPFTVTHADGRVETVDHGVIDVPFAAAPDLIGPDRIVAPYDFTWNDTHPLDTLGHGTQVAGTIGQLTGNGVGGAGMASAVRIMPVKVTAGSKWDVIFRAPFPGFADDRVARAIRYAADHGASAINMSFGRSGAAAPAVEDAVRYAVSRGAFCVFSAGNAALTGNPVERYAEIASRVDGAVSVGAVGPGLVRARYSSTGPWVELSAPGGDTFLTGTTGGILQQTLDSAFFFNPLVRPRFDMLVYRFAEGTSMAAPHVTGFAAILIQHGITAPSAIEAAMKQFAADRGAPGRDDEYGAGVINPRATLRGLGLGR